MVIENICFLLNQFIRCSAYRNVIFCWVMHEQEIIDRILSNLVTENCCIKIISLMCNEETLRQRLEKDVELGIREPEIVERSISRLPLYELIVSVKIFTDDKDVEDVAREIMAL